MGHEGRGTAVRIQTELIEGGTVKLVKGGTVYPCFLNLDLRPRVSARSFVLSFGSFES